MIRITAYHHKGVVEKMPTFPVKKGSEEKLTYTEDEKK